MEVTIYIDVLWLRTFFVELNVCIFVNLWMKQARSTVRILWMCALSVTMEVLLFVVAGYGAVFAVGSPVLRVLLLKVLFRPKSRGIFLRLFLWSLTATVAVGGIMEICQEHLSERYWFAAGCVLCAIGVMISLLMEERRVQHDSNLYRVKLLHEEHVVEVIGLYDTGNRLIDPYVHEPVHILARSKAQMLRLKSANSRLIPFSAVGASNGLMEVWTIDGMEWAGGRREHVVIGIAEDTLFEEKDYRLILAAGWRG
ncbi:MAG: sigma-E processing peptidase SpoIIGA [Lachnospiraceae bacterium]